MPEVLYEEVIEVDERVVLRQDGCQLPKKEPKRIVTGVIAQPHMLLFVMMYQLWSKDLLTVLCCYSL